MSSNNNSFTITDERLEWDRDDPQGADSSPEVSGEGEGETIVKASERMRTLLIAGEGALVGGMLVAFAAALVLSPSSSGTAAAKVTVRPDLASHVAHAVVLGPPTKEPRARQPLTGRKPTAGKPAPKLRHTQKKRRHLHHHTTKRPHTHTGPAATAHIHYRPRKHETKPASHHGGSK
ncbi:MAG: hypothetical protein JSS68_08345 [Actinobacteria bacterium]|nr:hypothetical protein [Actinomycetota bacterium]